MARDPRRETRPGSDLAHPDSRFDRFVGIEVHHEVRGPRGTPAVLLAHHFYGSVATWHDVMGSLGDDHLVAAFDRPGFGLTERPRRDRWGRWSRFSGINPYSRETSARIGWELLDHLGVDDAVLIGSSAGGTNVLEMYAQQPSRVRALVLISPAITGDVGPPAALRPLLRQAVARRLAPAVVRRLAGEVTTGRISRSWHDPTRATDRHAEPYRRMMRVDGWELGLWESITAEGPPDLRSVLRTIDVPALVVAGASDHVIAPRWSRRTADAIPGARFELLPECGHTPQEEAPSALVAVIRRFLADIAART